MSDRRTLDTPIHLLREWKENERVEERRSGERRVEHDPRRVGRYDTRRSDRRASAESPRTDVLDSAVVEESGGTAGWVVIGEKPGEPAFVATYLVDEATARGHTEHLNKAMADAAPSSRLRFAAHEVERPPSRRAQLLHVRLRRPGVPDE